MLTSDGEPASRLSAHSRLIKSRDYRFSLAYAFTATLRSFCLARRDLSRRAHTHSRIRGRYDESKAYDSFCLNQQALHQSRRFPAIYREATSITLHFAIMYCIDATARLHGPRHRRFMRRPDWPYSCTTMDELVGAAAGRRYLAMNEGGVDEFITLKASISASPTSTEAASRAEAESLPTNMRARLKLPLIVEAALGHSRRGRASAEASMAESAMLQHLMQHFARDFGHGQLIYLSSLCFARSFRDAS